MVSVVTGIYVNMWTELYDVWPVYNAIWVPSHGVIYKSLPLAIPTLLQPLKFLKQDLNIVWSPELIPLKLGVYHAAWSHSAGIIDKLFRWVTPTLHLWDFCYSNRNITSMPEHIFMELGTYIMPPKPIITAHIKISPTMMLSFKPFESLRQNLNM